MTRGLTRCGLLAVAALSAGCGEQGAAAPAVRASPPALLVSLAPRGEVPPAPGNPLPPGTRLLRVEPWRAGTPALDLGAGLAAAGQPRVSYDGRWVLFSARERAGDPTSLWRCRPDGSERTRAVGGERDQAAGAWLPDGRIVCAEALGSDPVEGPRRWALSVATGDGSPARRITFGVRGESDPELLPDGRVVFALRRATPAGVSSALWCVHPDGTGADLYHRPAAPTALLRRPRVLPDGRLVALCGPSADRLTAQVVDARAPLSSSRALAADLDSLTAVEPLQDGGLLLAREGDAAAAGLLHVAPDGTRTLLAVGSDGQRVLDVSVLEPRPVPQGHLSVMDAKKDWGQVLIVDAQPPGAAPARSVRLLAGHAGDPSLEPRLVGSAELAEDGSLFVRVPPDVPLWFEVLGSDGTRLARTHAPLWVRPNETRGCVGCHDERDTAPPNRRPRAVHAPALRLAPDAVLPQVEVSR